jgi:hypothetical protein
MASPRTGMPRLPLLLQNYDELAKAMDIVHPESARS